MKGVRRATIFLILAALWYPTAAVGSTEGVTVEWIVSDGGGVEAGGHVSIRGIPKVLAPAETRAVTFEFTVDWFDWGSHIRPQTIQWFAKVGCVEESPFGICRRNTQNVTLDLSVVPGSYRRGQSFTVTAYMNLFEDPTLTESMATVGLKMAALVECRDSALCAPLGQGNPAQKFAFLIPESSTAFRVSSAGAEVRGSRDVTIGWVVSDGGGVEAGGHVDIHGLPRVLILGHTYTVLFDFALEWFDWGTHISPRSISWSAKAGCLEYLGSFGVCLRNTQTIALGSSSVENSYAIGQVFSVVGSFSLSEALTVERVRAAIGLRMDAIVGCLEPSRCVTLGEEHPTGAIAFLIPESSVSFRLFSSSDRD